MPPTINQKQSFLQRKKALIVAKTKAFSIPGTSGFSLYEVWQCFIGQVKAHNLNERAAAISFNFVLAIPAATIFLFTLLPYFPLEEVYVRELDSLIKDITPDESTAKMIHDFQEFLNENLNKTRFGLLSFGFLFMMFNSSNALMGVIRTFDRSIQNLHKANFLRKRMRAIKLTIVVFFIFLGTLLTLAGQDILFNNLMDWLNVENETLKEWIKSVRWLVIAGLFFFSIGILYKYAPSLKRRPPLLSPGAFLATLLSMLFTWLFSVWVNQFMNLNKFYGSIGTVMILLILIYLNSLILLVGFELNVAIQRLKLNKDKKPFKK